VRTIVLGPRSADLDALIARRHALGHDLYDEVWEGEYHMAPAPHYQHGHLVMALGVALAPHARLAGLRLTDAFNLGEPDDYRVPDAGLHRSRGGSFLATAAMVIEVVSPDDESWLKFDHYARHGVDEVLIADPATETIAIFVLRAGAYERTDHSELLDLGAAALHGAIDWSD
jgi:Uma2 family endonuclease